MGNCRKGLRSGGGARWGPPKGQGRGLTSEKGAEFTGQSRWRELVLALLLGTDDFPGGGGGEWAGARVRPGTAPLPWPSSRTSWAPCHLQTPAREATLSGSSEVGWLSPTVLAPPGLVGVKEALTEKQGVQGHVLQQQPTALL